jgi:hypothetical protein
MTARKTLLIFFATPVMLYYGAFLIYFLNPLALHFRAWEFFDLFVYSGVYGRQHQVYETGDSSRNFLVQRYGSLNTITVNEFGNRIACYNKENTTKPRVLILGDSQLFGSGSGDSETFSAQLCQRYDANIYDGSRRHGRSLLRVQSLKFDTVLITATERYLMSVYHCPLLDKFAQDYDQEIPVSDAVLPHLTPSRLYQTVHKAHDFFESYLKARLGVLFSTPLRGPMAPNNHIDIARHQYVPVDDVVDREVNCLKKLTAFFETKGIAVGFLYFPAHQTLYAEELGFPAGHETLSFIDKMSDKLTSLGIPTMNTKVCLDEVKPQTLVYHKHDTHLNADGYRRIAECLGRSALAGLIRDRPENLEPRTLESGVNRQ